MTKRIPMNVTQKKICIICEGYEEYDYIQRLKELKIWNGVYSITTKNAKSLDKISAVYQNEYSNDNYDLVVILCDTEEAPYEKFKQLNKSLGSFHGTTSVHKQILYFANPCTLLIVLAHFGIVRLGTNDKGRNAALVERWTGIKDYQATEPQRKSIMRKITAENYATMKGNLSTYSKEEDVLCSTNFLYLLEKLEQGNHKWISNISKKLEKHR